MKPPYFSLNIRLLFLIYFGSGFESGVESGSEIRIRNRIRNVYFGSGSDPDPAKSFGSLRIRIRFRIRNTVHMYVHMCLRICVHLLEIYPLWGAVFRIRDILVRIRIRFQIMLFSSVTFKMPNKK